MEQRKGVSPRRAFLVLENCHIFQGVGVGSPGVRVGEVVFNTSLTGYQEIITDPSYAQQFITFTTPHIGNVGVNALDSEAGSIHTSGLIMRALSPLPSNWRQEASLETFLEERGVVGISGVDTRALTQLVRQEGALRACLVSPAVGQSAFSEAEALAAARAFGGLKGLDLAKEVTCKTPYAWSEGPWNAATQLSGKPDLHVVAYDFGIKRSILRELVRIGARVTVVPAQTPAEVVLSLSPDGVLFSNGPGDPEPCDYAIAAIQHFLRLKLPLMGVCLGMQLLALACGGKTVKMKFGHHGGNHPVQCIETGRVLITAQNHGFAVDETSLPADLVPTHRSLFDRTLQGMRHKKAPAFAFQGHPEAGPGPQDAKHLFDQFRSLMCQKEPI